MKWFTIWANSTSRSCLYDHQDSDITSINHLTEDSQSTSSSLPTIMSPSQRCLAFGYGLSDISLDHRLLQFGSVTLVLWTTLCCWTIPMTWRRLWAQPFWLPCWGCVCDAETTHSIPRKISPVHRIHSTDAVFTALVLYSSLRRWLSRYMMRLALKIHDEAHACHGIWHPHPLAPCETNRMTGYMVDGDRMTGYVVDKDRKGGHSGNRSKLEARSHCCTWSNPVIHVSNLSPSLKSLDPYLFAP